MSSEHVAAQVGWFYLLVSGDGDRRHWLSFWGLVPPRHLLNGSPHLYTKTRVTSLVWKQLYIDLDQPVSMEMCFCQHCLTSGDRHMVCPSHRLPVGVHPVLLLLIHWLGAVGDVIVHLLIVQSGEVLDGDQSHSDKCHGEGLWSCKSIGKLWRPTIIYQSNGFYCLYTNRVLNHQSARLDLLSVSIQAWFYGWKSLSELQNAFCERNMILCI